MRFSAAMVSDKGNLRANNEDNFNFFGKYRKDVTIDHSSYEASGESESGAVAVYDGMGGEAAGEIASLIAAKQFEALSLDKLPDTAISHLKGANAAVLSEAEKRGGYTMGCTIAALYMASGKAMCLNLGDSRTYLFRKGDLTVLSHDHSEAQGFIDSGSITENEAKSRRSWHVLTRYLGAPQDSEESTPYVSELFDVYPGDVYVLCTDGLTDMVSDQAMRALLGTEQTVKEAAADLLEMALMAGGKDNITIIVVRVEE